MFYPRPSTRARAALVAAALALTLSACATLGATVHGVRLTPAQLGQLQRLEELRRLDDAGELYAEALPDPDCRDADNASDWCVELRAGGAL